MWVIFGTNVKSERIAGGKVVQRMCSSCGENAHFYERRVVSTVQLYFLDVFNHSAKRAMACGACGTLFATDEVAETPSDGSADLQEGTVFGAMKDAWDKASTAVMSGAADLLHAGAKTIRANETSEPEAIHDEEAPAYDPDADLNERFAELERKAREKRGG